MVQRCAQALCLSPEGVLTHQGWFCVESLQECLLPRHWEWGRQRPCCYLLRLLLRLLLLLLRLLLLLLRLLLLLLRLLLLLLRLLLRLRLLLQPCEALDCPYAVGQGLTSTAGIQGNSRCGSREDNTIISRTPCSVIMGDD